MLTENKNMEMLLLGNGGAGSGEDRLIDPLHGAFGRLPQVSKENDGRNIQLICILQAYTAK